MAENQAQYEKRAITFQAGDLDFSIFFLFGLFCPFSTKKIVDEKILEKEE